MLLSYYGEFCLQWTKSTLWTMYILHWSKHVTILLRYIFSDFKFYFLFFVDNIFSLNYKTREIITSELADYDNP